MPQVRTITTSVAGPKFKEQGAAVEEFWRRMRAANGGRPGDPTNYINLVDVDWDEGRGWVIEYEVPVELLEQRAVNVIREDPAVNCQNVLEPAKLADATPAQTSAGPDLYMPTDPKLPERPKAKKCHVLSCMRPCVEGSSYCNQHQDKVVRFNDSVQPTEIMPSLIQVTGHNPRKTFDPTQLEELKASIREHGIIEPLMVRPKGNSRYELVVGERRLRAARELCLEHVPVVVRQLTDEQMLDIMLAENLQRVDLNPIEEAHHLKRVLEVGKLTQTELGRRVGKSQEWVSQRLRLAEAPGVLQDLIISRLISPWSAIEVLAWKNTEHYDAIMHEIGAWAVEGEELPRARVREIIKGITEPVPAPFISLSLPGVSESSDPTCKDCGNSNWILYGDGNVTESRRNCKFHGIVSPNGRHCERFVALSGPDPDPFTDDDQPFVNPEDCKDCDIYDRATNTCPEGCTNAEECEDCFCERTDDEEPCYGKGGNGPCTSLGPADCPRWKECHKPIDPITQDLAQDTEPAEEAAVEPDAAINKKKAKERPGERFKTVCRIEKGKPDYDRYNTGDEIIDIWWMLGHLFSEHHHDIPHQEAAKRVARCIRDGGDTMGLLRKLFSKEAL